MIQVVTEKQNYNPGDMVHGVIFIQTKKHVDCRFIHLDFFGREEASKSGIEYVDRQY